MPAPPCRRPACRCRCSRCADDPPSRRSHSWRACECGTRPPAPASGVQAVGPGLTLIFGVYLTPLGTATKVLENIRADSGAAAEDLPGGRLGQTLCFSVQTLTHNGLSRGVHRKDDKEGDAFQGQIYELALLSAPQRLPYSGIDTSMPCLPALAACAPSAQRAGGRSSRRRPRCRRCPAADAPAPAAACTGGTCTLAAGTPV